MNIISYNNDYITTWDEFVPHCPMATFLHTRRFLSYHQNRFIDMSLMIYDDNGRLIGLLPAALDPNNQQAVVSHPGITYGGVLHKNGLMGKKMIEVMANIIDFYKDAGKLEFIYKAVPYIYHQKPSSDDLYALFYHRADLYRRDLSCAIDLERTIKPNENRKRNISKAAKFGVQIGDASCHLEQFWWILSDNLQKRHQTLPVHTVSEMAKLRELFPENIFLKGAYLNDDLIAGTVLFITGQTVHTQYIANTEKGMKARALDLLFSNCIEQAKLDGFRYFDFGISNEQQGKYLNESLYSFKSNFGGGGIVHEFYKFKLN